MSRIDIHKWPEVNGLVASREHITKSGISKLKYLGLFIDYTDTEAKEIIGTKADSLWNIPTLIKPNVFGRKLVETATITIIGGDHHHAFINIPITKIKNLYKQYLKNDYDEFAYVTNIPIFWKPY